MKKYRIHSLPGGFGMLARLAFSALDGNLYAMGTRLVFTDEADDVAQPRVVFESFEGLEDWLVSCIADWAAEGKDDPMLEALDRELDKLV